MKIRYDHTYHLKKVELNERAVGIILKIMDRHNLGYDCDLFKITKYLEDRTTVVERDRLEIATTLQIINIINHIEKHDLLKKAGI